MPPVNHSSTGETKKPVRILYHDGSAYCIGLWWQTLPGGRSAAKKIIIKAAKDKARSFAASDYNHVAIRTSQYGLGHFSNNTQSKKFVSLAASLRSQRQDDTMIGIFNFGPDLWWLCQISSGIIGADGDAWFSSEEDARNALSSIRQLLQSQEEEIFCDTPDASWKFLAPLLKPENPLVQLNTDDPSKRKIKQRILAAGTMVSLVFGGFYAWSLYEEYQEQQTMTMALEVRNAGLKAKMSHAEQFFDKKWNDTPPPAAIGAFCSRALLEVPLVYNGWHLIEADCKNTSLNVIWGHARYADFLQLPPESRFSAPQKATAVYSLPKLPSRAKEDSLLQKDTIPPRLYQLAQNLSALLVLNWLPVETYQIDEENTVSAPWQACDFTLTKIPSSSLLTNDIFDAINFPGIVVTSVNKQGITLTIKGTFYGKVSK
jgi:hypothetical protein